MMPKKQRPIWRVLIVTDSTKPHVNSTDYFLVKSFYTVIL